MKKILCFIAMQLCFSVVFGQIKNTPSESKNSLTIELLMVEYRHIDGFMWGFDVVNGQSNYLSETSINASNTSPNVSLNFDITQRLGEAFKINLQALVSKELAVISQNPRVTVKDGDSALINISEDRYIQLQTASQNGLTTNLINLTAGVSLNITPKTLDNGNISLSVDGTLSDFLRSDGDDSNQYAIESSKIQTVVDLPLDKTLVIGGMLREKKVKNEGGIPLLKDIPLLGKLFTRISNQLEVVETVMYITVYVQKTSNSDDGAKLINLRSKKIDEFDNNYSNFLVKKRKKRKSNKK